MRRAFLILALLAALGSIASRAQTVLASGIGVQDGTGALLGSGTWCFNTTCLSVSNGVFSGAISPGTQNVTVVNSSSATVLTVPNVTVQAGQPFNWNLYVVPENTGMSGVGQPYLPCSPGSSYAGTSPTQTLYCQSYQGQSAWGPTQTPASSGFHAGYGAPTFPCVSPCVYSRLDTAAFYNIQQTPGLSSANWTGFAGSGTYLPLSGGTVSGTITANALTGPLTGNVTGNVTGHASLDLPLSGGTVSGNVSVTGNVSATNISGTAITGTTLSANSAAVGSTITGPYFSLKNLSSIPSTWIMDATTPSTALASLGGVGTSGGTFAGAVNVPALNLVEKCDQFSGATADVKLAACIAALPSGGTADARGFGATTQTIASTVAVGNGKTVTLLFDPATIFTPASTTTTMLDLYGGAHVFGFYSVLVSGYSVPAITIQHTVQDNDRFELVDTRIIGQNASPTSGSGCVAIIASSASEVWMHIQRLRCNYVYTGLSMSASGSSFINSNLFSDLVFDGNVTAISTNGANITAAIAQNQFVNLATEAGASWAANQIVMAGFSYDNSITNWSAFDTHNGNYDITFAGSSTGNMIYGALPAGFSDTTSGANNVISGITSAASSGTYTSQLLFPRVVNPANAPYVRSLTGLCPNITSGQTCYWTWGDGTINGELDLNKGSSANASSVALGLGGGAGNLQIAYSGAVKFGAGSYINSSNAIPQYCGLATFSGSTSSTVSCSAVTGVSTSSHCLATWNGTNVSGGALGAYIASGTTATVTAATSNSGVASVYCSGN